MKLVPVDSIPKATHKPNKIKLKEMLEDFVHSQNTIVKVNYTKEDYSNVYSCVQSLCKVRDFHGFPIRVVQRGCDIYLKKEEK